jgi:GH15 family glucan-1,4-alpha-glucosidase
VYLVFAGDDRDLGDGGMGREGFTHSKVMAWAAADRMARSVRGSGLPGPALRWEGLREQIHHDVVTRAFDAGRNTFTQAYGSAALDASLLLIPRVGFLPATDRVCWARSPRSAAN